MKRLWKQSTYVTIVILVLISPLIPASSSITEFHDTTISFFRFHSYIEIEYDSFALNKEIQPDNSITIPIYVKYHTDVPQNFLRFLPWRIRNLIIFDSIIAPIQTIHLEIVNQPDWANIYLSTPNILVDIPFGDNVAKFTTTIVLSVNGNAPAEPHTFLLIASCEDVGSISGCQCETNISFTPAWIPRIEIKTSHSSITGIPGSMTNVKINITNNGNSDVIVFGEINNIEDGWGISLEPSIIPIQIDQMKTATLHIGIPEDCTNCIFTIYLVFNVTRLPYNDESFYYGPIYIRVQGVAP